MNLRQMIHHLIDRYNYKFVDEWNEKVLYMADDVIKEILTDVYTYSNGVEISSTDVLEYEVGSTHGGIIRVKLPTGERMRIPYRII